MCSGRASSSIFQNALESKLHVSVGVGSITIMESWVLMTCALDCENVVGNPVVRLVYVLWSTLVWVTRIRELV